MNLSPLRRWQRWVLLSGLGVVLLWLVTWAAVPRLLLGQIEKQGTQLLGRVVKVEQVVFQPWSMTLILRGLQIGQAGATGLVPEPQLSIDEIEINAALQSLLLWAPVADAVVVRHPQLNLTHQGQGRFDMDDVLQRFSGDASSTAGIPRLSLFNIQIEGGGVLFRDAPKSVTHKLSDVQLNIPFLSNIGGRRDVATHPRLAFKLNGAAFDTDAQTTPFSKDRQTQARFQVHALDVAPYRAYWPAAWPVRLADGRLELDIHLDFRQQAEPQVLVSGHVTLNNLKLQEKVNGSDLPLLQLDGLDLKIAAWRPLEAVFKLDALQLEKPVLHVRRERDGELNWARLQRSWVPAARDEKSPSMNAATYVLKQFQMTGGQLHWQDAMTRMPVNLALTDIDFQANNLSWPSPQLATLQGHARIQGASLAWDGSTDLTHAEVRLKWSDFALKTLAPYWAEFFHPDLTGQSAAELSLDWRAATGTEPSSLLVKVPQVRVTDVSLGLPDKQEAALAELTLEQIEVDVFKQQARVGRVAMTRPRLNLSRSASGRWMLEDWPVDAPLPTPKSTSPNPWQLDLGPLQITDGAFHLDDRYVAKPVKLDVRDLNLSLGPWQPLAALPQMTPLKLDLSTGSQRRDQSREKGRNQIRELGKLNFEGAFRLPSMGAAQTTATPLQLQGRLQLARWPVHSLSPYLADLLNFDLRRADLSYVGGLDMSLPEAGMGLNVHGNLSVENLHAFNLSDAEPLLDIQALNLRGLEMGFKAGALHQLKIAETSLRDFFARVAIDATGRLNLQNLLKSAPTTAAQPAAVTPWIAMGPVGVVNGRVLFSDQFIQPNYSADVTELAGSLGAFSNQTRDANAAQLAELSLRGRVAGSGSLEVNGRIQPLTRPVALDVRGQVRDLELPQLSPYSNKYAGYGIERGKLSAEVNYRIGADAQLQATHQIVLNQLRFGERSGAADAPNLPVKLAVALLADRNGVIDLNLPVNGSINDPDFRVGPTIWKMVLSLIGKAAIAPFSLISAAFSGEDQLQQMGFAPGHADVDAATRLKLEAVAQLLRDKPALSLTIVGEAHLDTERDAWREVSLHESVLAEKRRRLDRDGQHASAVVEVSSEEYPALLKSVYRRSPFPKPRNVLGLVKDLPPADMEALLLAALSVGESDMRELAQARASHVRKVLLALSVPAEQLFLGAPVIAAALAPRVTLVVSTD